MKLGPSSKVMEQGLVILNMDFSLT